MSFLRAFCSPQSRRTAAMCKQPCGGRSAWATRGPDRAMARRHYLIELTKPTLGRGESAAHHLSVIGRPQSACGCSVTEQMAPPQIVRGTIVIHIVRPPNYE